MQAILDLPAVRVFAAELRDRIRHRENGNGSMHGDSGRDACYYVQACDDFHAFAGGWAKAVFSGRVAFEREAEDLLKGEAEHLLREATGAAALARGTDAVSELEDRIARLARLLEKWVSPRLAVGPSARVILSDASAKQIRERLDTLAPLPADWRPTGPEQLKIFEQKD